MSALVQLLGFLKHHCLRITGSVVLGAGTILAGVGLLASSGYLISAAALRPPILDLMVVIVTVRFFGITRAVLRYSERLLSHDITFRLLMKIRSNFFRMITALPASGMQGFRSGSLLSSIVSDVEELQNFYIRVFTPFMVALVVSLVTFYFLHGLSPAASWVMLLLLAVNGVVVPLVIRRLARGLGEEQLTLRSELHHYWLEQMQGMEESRLFGMQPEYRRHIASLCENLSNTEQRQSVITGLQDTLFNWILFAAVFAALLVTTPLVIGGELSGVMLALVLLSVMASFEATQNLGTAFQYHESTEKALENLNSLSGGKNVPQHDTIGRTVHEALGESGRAKGISVSFINIEFTYEKRKILKKIDVTIPEATHYAVVGPTGSGKSTLIQLLLRFYEPDVGSIRLGGCDISSMSPEQVRSLVSVVDQSTYVFNDTLRNNLLLAKPEAGDSELLQKLEQAELGSRVAELPDGLDTFIGEHGKNLSGGERQRLAVTRALLKEAPVWVLDEPTANLDTITERSLIRTIRRVTAGKTVLWITHRLVEMPYFDRIMVMQEGSITDFGGHGSLVGKQGWYADMVEIQSDALLEYPNGSDKTPGSA